MVQGANKSLALTFDGSFAVEFRAEHLHTEVKHGQGKQNTDAEADTPYGGQVVLASGRQDNQEDRHRQWTAELLREVAEDSILCMRE